MLDGTVAAVAALQCGHMKNKVGAEVLSQRCTRMERHLGTQPCRAPSAEISHNAMYPLAPHHHGIDHATLTGCQVHHRVTAFVYATCRLHPATHQCCGQMIVASAMAKDAVANGACVMYSAARLSCQGYM